MNIAYASKLTKHVFDFYYYNIEQFKQIWNRIILLLKEYLPEETPQAFLKFYADEDGADFILYVETSINDEQAKELEVIIPKTMEDLVDNTMDFEIVINFVDKINFEAAMDDEMEDE